VPPNVVDKDKLKMKTLKHISAVVNPAGVWSKELLLLLLLLFHHDQLLLIIP
jgi:hypothetical protein